MRTIATSRLLLHAFRALDGAPHGPSEHAEHREHDAERQHDGVVEAARGGGAGTRALRAAGAVGSDRFLAVRSGEDVAGEQQESRGGDDDRQVAAERHRARRYDAHGLGHK